MICKPCKDGAADMTVNAPAGLTATAEWQHGLCQGGTWCDCQHVLRSALVGVSSPSGLDTPAGEVQATPPGAGY